MRASITVVQFSPTGGTRRCALALAEGLAERLQEVDLSLPKAGDYTFGQEDLVLFAGPVYGGRIPEYMVEGLKRCVGQGTPAITAVVYGNRAYEDALLELNDCVQAHGFQVVASAALVAEHSICRAVATGRPDEADREALHRFAAQISEKLGGAQGDAAVHVPGGYPYKEWTPMPAVPVVSDDCIGCGLCAQKCPTQAIPADQPKTTDPARCILCMRCVSLCPQKARALPAPVQAMMGQKLSPLQAVRCENELFL